MAGLARSVLRHAVRRTPTHLRRLRLGRAAATFTFDDCPASAASAGAEILEARDARGTFYVAGGLCGRIENGKPVLDAETVRALHQSGHEIGCHTFSHRAVPGLSRGDLEAEIARNGHFLRNVADGLEPVSFAYPYGELSLAAKFALKRRFVACRGVRNGVNRGWVDLGQLRVVDLFGTALDAIRIDTALRTALASNGWIIFYTHDVEDRPTRFGCAPQVLEAALARVLELGFEVGTVAATLRRAGLLADERARPPLRPSSPATA
jgi:peptidoglycan/xylan/chitin deacetylase (PgdA/CDA1 family)